jgi:dihydropteroate synthase
MRRYYTRVCNFYYGYESRLLVNSNKAIPLNGNKNISFDHIEIISRSSKKKISINKINKSHKIIKKINQIRFKKNKIQKKKFFKFKFFTDSKHNGSIESYPR